MHYCLESLSLATATLLLSLTSPLLPLTLKFEPLAVQAQTTQDRKAEALQLNKEGVQLLNRGQIREALQKFQAALVISREIGDRRREGSTLGNIGKSYFELKQYSQALDAFQQALAISRELSDRRGEAAYLENIRRVQLAQSGVPILDKAEVDRLIKQGRRQLKDSQLREASQTFQQVLGIYRERGNRAEEAAITRRIGSIYRNVEQHTQALEYFQQALAIYREMGDRQKEAYTLGNIGWSYFDLEQYPMAMESFQQGLAIHRELGDRQKEAAYLDNIRRVQLAQSGAAIPKTAEEERLYEQLFEQGEQQLKNGQFREASQTFQQVLDIYRKLGDRAEEASTTLEIGSIYGEVGQNTQALEYFQQALAIYREIGAREDEAEAFEEIGEFYLESGQSSQGLEYLKQALAIYTDMGERKAEASTLGSIGWIYFHDLKQPSQALKYFQQGLEIYRELGDRRREAAYLENIRRVQLAQSGVAILSEAEAERLLEQVEDGQFQEALQSLQQALEKYRERGDRAGEATITRRIGSIYAQAEPPIQALKYYQQALAIYRELGARESEAETFEEIGDFYLESGQSSQGLEYLKQALAIYTELGARKKQAYTLSEIGEFYFDSKQYSQGLEYSQQALAIYTELGDLTREVRILNNIGKVYDENLKQYSQALEYYQQAWVIRRDSCDRTGEERTLQSLQKVYSRRSLAEETPISDRAVARLLVEGLQQLRNNQLPEAAQSFQKALEVERKGSNRKQEAFISRLIGWSYTDLGQHTQALDYFQQALAIYREMGDRNSGGSYASRREELSTLDNIGWSYVALKQYPQALESFQQALATYREIGDSSKGDTYTSRSQEATALNTIGSVLEAQNQPELAIIFYKQFVSITEAFRKNLQVLPSARQNACSQTSPNNVYRHLANLLLKQDRILEAQRVLDLLKVQELDDYLRNVRGNNNTNQGLPNLLLEQQTWASYEVVLDKAVEIGKELTQLRQIRPENRTPAQEQRIAQLVKSQEKIIEDFNNFSESPEVLALIQQLSPKSRKPDLVDDLEDLIGLQDNLKNLQQKAVLLYPLILDDRIELILTTPDSPPIRRTVHVSKKQLNETIAAFRSALQDPKSDAKIPAQQLYNWLIKPLEPDLKAADAETIVYAPDAQLRYIPLAALYDGQQWLVQRYRINNITATSLTELNTQPQRQLQVLAGAFATGRYSFTVGGQDFNFAGLPFAGTEVENLAKTVPTTTKLIDKAFTPQVTVPKMDDYTVVHLATHAAFVVGTPDDSFILFGNGDRITLRDIQKWSLKNVDLVVLSACETGLGGKLGNGEEILGLGYQMQRAGARAAIASLWTVDDGGTQALMNAFYATLKKGNTTKAEALRQAQIALITSDYTALAQKRGGIVIERIGNTSSPDAIARLSHPYYWAPFILIGNGL
ncbi:tetratricopeptide repeat protein [Coleofasciculus sp. FACHB-T130]|uniref:CHAT domain-containing protein n=1 Tax=Cyanophyceae TaxID=3028117 RepID=UPI001685B401|nr:tetratricopeptide repeat protein [Coleofasciculus sp. FACHB-T130]MBD1879937.1 tetratricopeptide repeat protein [Coleofasciculus sp. FACHB-T130]